MKTHHQDDKNADNSHQRSENDRLEDDLLRDKADASSSETEELEASREARYSDELVSQVEACALKYYRQSKLRRSRIYVERLVKMRSENAQYWTLLGVICRRQNQRGPALQFLKRAAEIDPRDFNTLVNLGETLVEIGQVPAGVELLRAVFDEGYDPTKPPEKQDQFTIRSGAILEFVQKSLRSYVAAQTADSGA